MALTDHEIAAFYTPDIRRRIADFRAWMAQDPERRTQRTCARMLRCEQATLNKLLNERYPANPDRLTREMGRVIKRAAQRADSPGRPPFVKTDTALEVQDAIHVALVDGVMTAVIGPTGVGKTMAAQEFHAGETAALWITAGPTCTEHAILQELCRILDIQPHWSAYAMQRDIIEKLEGTGQVVIVDEADDMELSALKVLRIIHDATHVGVVLIGTSDLLHNLRRKRSATVNQILGRIADVVHLGGLTRDQLDKIVEPFALDEGTLESLWNGAYGSARRAVAAIVVAQRNKQKLTARSIRSAYAKLMPVMNGLAQIGAKVTEE